MPTRLNKKPKRIISHALIPPCAKTIALGGVLIGIINEKLAQIVTTSISNTREVSLKNGCVATSIIGKSMAIKAVVDKNPVAIIENTQAKKIKAMKGKPSKRAKNEVNAPPSSACENAVAIQNPAPNKNIIS